jgi:hypothetical protein
MRDRFHIVVFNYDRMRILIGSLGRLIGFDPARDRLIVVDCSRDPTTEHSLLASTARARSWPLGTSVRFLRRQNWGNDLGGRIDAFGFGLVDVRPAEFVWQFQDHYLDLESPISRDARVGDLREDTIGDPCGIDLDRCEAFFRTHTTVGIIHGCRNGIPVFSPDPSRRWLLPDGGNACIRRDALDQVVSSGDWRTYRAIYDGSYRWALFMELEWGRLLWETGTDWCALDGTIMDRGGVGVAGTLPAGTREEVDAEFLYEDFRSRFERMGRRRPAIRKAMGACLPRLWGTLHDLRADLRAVVR